MKIAPLTAQYLSDTKLFTDEQIGKGYYSESDLSKLIEKSQETSFLLLEGQNVRGVRLSYPPKAWLENERYKAHCSFEKWPCQENEMGYFQSLFIHPNFQKQGWGQKLSLKSIEALESIGAKAILCHSWKESPGNSSIKYLEKLGFKEVAEHPNFWKPVDYECTRCGKPPCLCTAVEMVLELKGN